MPVKIDVSNTVVVLGLTGTYRAVILTSDGSNSPPSNMDLGDICLSQEPVDIWEPLPVGCVELPFGCSEIVEFGLLEPENCS